VPEKRYGSCCDFAEALREALGPAPYHSLGSAPAADHPRTETAAPQPELSGPDLAGTGKAAVLGSPAAAATTDWAPGGEPASPADVPAAAVIAIGPADPGNSRLDETTAAQAAVAAKDPGTPRLHARSIRGRG
jgi:hypothetical protein